ncbi:MAG: hypothetical protein WA817_23825 [Candidatus Acidiferrum sp.]
MRPAEEAILAAQVEGQSEWDRILAEEELRAAAAPAEIKLPDMPDSVLDGRLGEICKGRMGDLPISYSWPALVVAAGLLVKPTKKVLRPNIYVALVGPVHSGKSVSIDRALYLLNLESPIVQKTKAGSAEGLLADIGDVGGDARLLYPDELAHTFGKAQIQNASFTYVLNSLFYNDNDNLTIAHGKKVPFNGRLSIAGGIVEENFGDSFGSATTGGLYDRFIFGQCPSDFQYLHRPQEDQPAFKLKNEASYEDGPDSLDTGDKQPIEVFVNPDVWDARDQLAKAEKLNPRLLEITLRMAAICAAFDGRVELRAADLSPAWEMARYQHRVRMLLQPNPGKNFEAQVAHKVLAYLRRHESDGQWLVLRQVLRDTRAYDFGPSVVERALNAMTFGGAIEQGELPGGRGQKKRLVRLTGNHDEN